MSRKIQKIWLKKGLYKNTQFIPKVRAIYLPIGFWTLPFGKPMDFFNWEERYWTIAIIKGILLEMQKWFG